MWVRVRSAASTVLALAILAGGIWLVGWALQSVYHAFKSLNADLAKQIVIAASTVVVASISVFGGRFYERRQAIRRDLQDKRKPIYETFIRGMFAILGVRGESAQTVAQEPAAMLSFLGEFTESMIIWGSDDLLHDWSAYKSSMGSLDPKESLVQFADIILKMRHDLGHKNKNINSRTILSTFITDLDTTELETFPREPQT